MEMLKVSCLNLNLQLSQWKFDLLFLAAAIAEKKERAVEDGTRHIFRNKTEVEAVTMMSFCMKFSLILCRFLLTPWY